MEQRKELGKYICIEKYGISHSLVSPPYDLHHFSIRITVIVVSLIT